MKRITSILLLIITLFTLVGCKSKYPPVESTEEEAKTVYTLEYGGKRYEIKYELYRALFLSNKDSVDGGDSSVWSGDNKEEHIERINEIIIGGASEIFAAFALAEKIGINIYSKEINKLIEERIALNVEGNGADVIGFGGSYDDYLASLTELNLNYSVQEMLLRYSIAVEKINEYYIGTTDEVLGNMPGEYEFTEEDVEEYYYSDDCARVLHAYMREGITNDTKSRMEQLRAVLLDASDAKSAALTIINYTATTPTDLIVDKEVSGIIVGKNTISDNFYKNYREAVFSTAAGEVSEVVEVNDGVKGYYIIYGLDKDGEHFEKFYEDIKVSYLDNVVSTLLVEIAESLKETVSADESYSDIIHAEISMKQ